MVGNAKLGYTFSVVLHILVAVAMFAWALIDVLFPNEVVENKIVFEMVEPSENPPAPPSPPVNNLETNIKVEKNIENIKPLELPPEDVNPPEELKPAEDIKPPEKTETKPEQNVSVPKPPKKVNFKDWVKGRKLPTNNPNRKSTKQNKINISKITSSHVAIDSISSISQSTASSSQAMQDALSEYTRVIYMTAKRNWKIPTINTDSLSAKISFKVSKTGIISNVRILESSGDKDFDNSIIQVFKSITIPPPPDNSAHTINITFRAS